MNIEKKKVAKNKPLSSSAKSAIVGLLGMTAAISLGACENGSSADSDDEPLDGDVFIPPNNQKNPQSSSETATQTSSSSQIVDIPLSHEPLSSSAIEALSSAARLSAMRPISSSITAGIPHVYSSPTVPPSSSSITTPPLAGDIIPIEHSSSSSATQPSSSSANDEIIKNNPEIDLTPIPTDFPAIKDSLIRIHLCEDPNSPGCLIESMVTTLETNDIA